jgi:hypothetical protein
MNDLPLIPDPTADELFDFAGFCSEPRIRGSAPAKIAILRGPIYAEDAAWEALLRHQAEVERFLAEIGVRLTLNVHDGYAFADQASEGEPGSDWPRLFYRDRFSYDVTCVLLVLREWLLRRESVTSDEHSPLTGEELIDSLRRFSRKQNANVEREDKRWREAINKVIDQGFLRVLKAEEERYVVRPIIRAKLDVETLAGLRVALEKAAGVAAEQSGEERP